MPTVTPFENFEDMERTLRPFGDSALQCLNLALYGAGALSNRVMLKKQDGQEMVYYAGGERESMWGTIIFQKRLFGECKVPIFGSAISPD